MNNDTLRKGIKLEREITDLNYRIEALEDDIFQIKHNGAGVDSLDISDNDFKYLKPKDQVEIGTHVLKLMKKAREERTKKFNEL